MESWVSRLFVEETQMGRWFQQSIEEHSKNSPITSSRSPSSRTSWLCVKYRKKWVCSKPGLMLIIVCEPPLTLPELKLADLARQWPISRPEPTSRILKNPFDEFL